MKAGIHRWELLDARPEAESGLSSALGLSPLLARILWQRGYDSPEKADRFLNPRLRDLSDPFETPSLRDAAVRLWKAVESHERVVIYGDYDVDGITSTALLYRVLRAVGADVAHFLPRRMDEGYGLSADGIDRCLAEHNPRLLLAVDCGTTATREIAALQQQGVEVIVVDHHSAAPEMPSCLLINPKLTSDHESVQPHRPIRNLATVGLAFKLAHGFLKLGRQSGRRGIHDLDLTIYLDLVAVGTVADVVPLDGENRIFVKAGLEQLARTCWVGLRALKAVARVPSRPNPHHIGFQLGPRLNAMGRLSDALASLELLLTDDSSRARELAELLDDCNRERQEIEQRLFEEALEAAGKPDSEQRVIVLARDGWHVGVVGIVASRIMREFYRPTVIIAIDGDGIGKGSCRSIEGFPIVDALRRCSSWLKRFGGHQAAAGLSIEAGNVEPFSRQLETIARETIREDALRPTLRASAELSLHQLDSNLMGDLARLEPHGMGNPPPVFVSRDVRLRARPRTVGRGHLKLWLTDGVATFAGIGYGAGDWQPSGDRVDVAFTPQWNDFYRGEPAIQLKLMDVREV